MQGWEVTLLVLAAVFVGMWIPVSLQLVVTLRSAKRFLETIGKNTLTEVSTAVAAANETIADLQKVVRAFREPGAEFEYPAARSNGRGRPAPAQEESTP